MLCHYPVSLPHVMLRGQYIEIQRELGLDLNLQTEGRNFQRQKRSQRGEMCFEDLFTNFTRNLIVEVVAVACLIALLCQVLPALEVAPNISSEFWGSIPCCR